MPEITLSCEDSFHEKFVGALLDRFAQEYGVGIVSNFFSARGGLPHMQNELKDFLRDLAKDRQSVPDCLIVVGDANCQGYNGRKVVFESVLNHYPQFQQLVQYAIPDPHIERWMLIDPRSFQAVFARGCTTPANKCARDEYKKILRAEIRAAGIEAPLGGEEFAHDIVNAMDLAYTEMREASFGLFVRALKGLFNAWRFRATV